MPTQNPLPNVYPLDDLAAQFKRFHQRITSLERASTSGSPVTPPTATIPQSAIIELATTPTGVTNELQWSTVHQALVRRFGGQWQFAEGPPAYFQYDDLWATGGPITMSQVLAGTFDQVSDSTPHFGVWRISSVATANSGANMRGGGGWTSGAGGIRFRGVVMLWNTSAGSLQRIGFHESLNATAPGDGAWLEVVAGVATFKTASSPLTTANPTTATLSAFTWYTIHIWFTNNGVSARCVVINDSGTVVLDVSNTTNLPSGPDRFYAGAQALFTTASAQTLMDVDWLGWGYQQ